MDIKIPHSWLLEYIDTRLKAKDIASLVSLGGPSIDRVVEQDGEILYEVEITTNRPDAFSVYGFAREVAALLQLPFKEKMSKPLVNDVQKKQKKLIHNSQEEYHLSIRIQEPKKCPRYCGSIMTNVVVGPSPDWMKKRLELMGLRSINNVVDITNYVMLEYGQPLHAFDSDLIDPKSNHKTIIVRNARKGELFQTLDGEERILDLSHLVIADSVKPLALAGIKGGISAGITPITKTILLESTNFNPVLIRTTSRDLGLRTDASTRFEKGLSPELSPFALARAQELLQQYAHATCITPFVESYPVAEKPKKVRFSLKTYQRIVGVPLVFSRAQGHLKKLGFRASGLSFDVPFWRRADIDNDLDLVEEVARMERYSTLSREHLRGSLPPARIDRTFQWESATKHLLRDYGWTECMTYSLISQKLHEQCLLNHTESLGVVNPLSLDFSLMRPSLIPGLLAVLAENDQKSDEIKIFELGTIFTPLKKNELPQEPLSLVLVYAKKKASVQELFSEIRGICENLFHNWFSHIPLSVGKGSGHVFFDSARYAELCIGEKVIGRIGIPNKKIISSYGIKIPFGLVEIDFSSILPSMTLQKKFVPLAKYPSVVRDIACVVEKKVSYDTIQCVVKKANSLIGDIELFDLFEHATLGASRKSVAFHITYQSLERTLTAQEVDEIHESVKKLLKEKIHAEIR